MIERHLGPSQPGDLVREYARRRDWPIAQYNLMVEGEHDQVYFHLASDLHRGSTGKQLVGDRLAVFPPGSGDAGGTFGIQRDFPTLRSLIDADLSRDGNRLFVLVALLDSDSLGKQAYRALTARHTLFQANRDLFLLQREFPRVRRDAAALTRAIEQANAPWRTLDCEIEDLISVELIEAFCQDEPNCDPIRRQSEGGRVHFDFEPHAKAKLCRYVWANAMTPDIANMIEVLKSLRFYLGLDPDGDLDETESRRA